MFKLDCFFLSFRLASLCEKRVNQDQRSVENVLASNQPSDVERDFKEFFDGTREDARDVIQSVYGSEEKEDVQIYYPRIVCTILVVSVNMILHNIHIFSCWYTFVDQRKTTSLRGMLLTFLVCFYTFPVISPK